MFSDLLCISVCIDAKQIMFLLPFWMQGLMGGLYLGTYK